MTEYMNYAMAKKNGDQNGMDTAKNNLNKMAGEFGNLLKTEDLPADAITKLINEHFTGTLALIDAHSAGDAVKEADLMKMGADQAGKIADTLSGAVR